MRTSRVSRETAKVATATSKAPRRSTRTSLARFRHNVPPEPTYKDEDNAAYAASADDIEDTFAPAQKRQRRSSNSSPDAKHRLTITKTSVETLVTSTPTTPPKARKVARKPARAVKNEQGEVEIHAPSDWEAVYAVVKEMRLHGNAARAAVDTMGCERLAADEASPRDRRYQTLTALMLSSQTKDTTNAQAMKRLQTELPAHAPGAPEGLNLENILAVEPKLLNELIWAVGFHNNKTRYIKATAEILRDVWAGDIPDSIEGLTSLPGVGPKMAYLCLSTAWGRDEGIGVDVHVHRITNLWGWHKTKGPEETRLALQAWLPREKWHEINWLLVGLGQTVCLPVGRKCGECELGLRGMCKAAERGKVIAGRKLEEERVKLEDGQIVGVEMKNVKEEVIQEEVMNALSYEASDVQGQEKAPAEDGLVKEEEKSAAMDMNYAPRELKKMSIKPK